MNTTVLVVSVHFYIGGKMEFGETVEAACKREVKEECGEDVEFTFKKILYIRDFIKPEDNEHSLELFILGDINQTEEIEGRVDEEFPTTHRQTWVNVNKLPDNLLPKGLTPILRHDFKNKFRRQGIYLREI